MGIFHVFKIVQMVLNSATYHMYYSLTGIPSYGNIVPFKGGVNYVAEFLAQIFHKSKCKYSTNNTASSVFLSIFATINAISLLLKGMFK